MPIKELCRNGGLSDATFYKWRAKFGGMQASEAQRLRELESENAKLKRLLAESANGWIKNVLGLRQFSMRGLHRVQAEWKLLCIALNLRRMAKMQAG